MSKKRTSDEFNNDEQTLFQNEDNAKRANVDSNNDTTLQDLPMELLECILVKVVATEVMDLRLVKTVWKEKVDPVIHRIETVCLQWNHILSTNSFRTKLHRMLDGTAEEMLLLQVLYELPDMHSDISYVTTLNDEIFMMYKPRDQNCTIHVYDRSNMVVVKDVIPLPGGDAACMAACKVSNCVYVGLPKKLSRSLSVLRISKDAEHQFSISPWMEDHKLCIYLMSVTVNGSLIMISEKHQWEPHVVSEYNANGFLQQEIQISKEIDTSRYKKVIQRPNGNFILAYINKENRKTKLSEIDRSGSVVRQYQSLDTEEVFVGFADSSGKIVIVEYHGGTDLLDSEFNLQGTYYLRQDEDKTFLLRDLHFDSERNEILRIYWDFDTRSTTLTVFRFNKG